MAVLTNIGGGEMNGYEDTLAAFVASHESNTHSLLNVTEGKKKTAPRPPYNPNAPENRWPLMVHHETNGEKAIGKSIVGLSASDSMMVTKQNESDLKMALASRWRLEPYEKPQVVILPPEVEKQRLIDQNKALEGQIAMVFDIARKQQVQLESLQKQIAESTVAGDSNTGKGK